MQPSRTLLQEMSLAYPVGLMGAQAPQVFARRREALLQRLDIPAVFTGLEQEPGSETPWLMSGTRIFQEPAFLYLTGINQAGATLLLDPGARDPAHRVQLFLPSQNPAREFWDGPRLGLLPDDHPLAEQNLAHLRLLLGISAILPAESFRPNLLSLVERRSLRRLGAFFHRYPDPEGGKPRVLRTDFTWKAARRLQNWVRPLECTIESIAPLHWELRQPLDKWQIKESERAQEWTRTAFLSLLPQLPRLSTEAQVASTLEGLMGFQSTYGLAFPTICATGRNACTLHYVKNDEPLDRSALLLLDFGCRSGTQHADISRTVPVGGRFSPLQRLVYEMVLEAQALNESTLRPGTTVRAQNHLVWDFLEKAIEERILRKGGEVERVYVEGRLQTLPGKSKAHPCQPHGVSHLIGEQIHDGDPFRLYQDLPVQPGWLLSNEPGFYGRVRLRLGTHWHEEWIGIRIEDDLLVTENGNRNLSASIPKDPDELERLVLPGETL